VADRGGARRERAARTGSVLDRAAAYSIFVRGIEQDVLPVAQRSGMGVLVWSPLAGGWLAGRYRRGQDTPKDSRAVRFAEQGRAVASRYDMSLPENQRKLEIVEELIDLAEKQEMPLQHLALAFVLEHPGVTSAIVGPRTMEQLEDLLGGAEARVSDDALDRIDELVPPGSVVLSADRGFEAPWMAPEARRRR